MKKLVLIAASLLVAGVIFGHGNNWSQKNNGNQTSQNEIWQKMNAWRQVMHDTKVEAIETDSGVRLVVTPGSKEALKILSGDFGISEPSLTSYFKPVAVTLETKEDSLIIDFSSKDSQLTQRLKKASSGLFYEFLQQNMYALMQSNGSGMWGGQHMMGGFGGQRGYGPGMMNGHFQGCPGGGTGFNQGNIQQSSGFGSGMMNPEVNRAQMM